MIKTIYCLTVAVVSLFCAPIIASENVALSPIDCAQQLRPVLKKILSIDEARKLIADIQKEGPIHLRLSNHPLSRQFGAFWDIDERAICISMSAIKSEGDLIGSILFELQNAAVNTKLENLFDKAAAGTITRENYIKSMEYLEYENSIRAAAIAQKGIDQGRFPRDARLHTYGSFEEHYHFQKKGGHSAMVGRSYDELAPKRNGTS